MADDTGPSMINDDQGPMSTESPDADVGTEIAAQRSNAAATTTEDSPSPDENEPPSPSLAVTPAPAERKSSAKTGLDSPSPAPAERKSLKSSASATAGEKKESASRAASQPESKAASKVPSARTSNVDQTRSLSKGTAMDGKSGAAADEKSGAAAEEKSSQQNFYQGPFAKISPFDKFHFVPKDEKTEVPDKLKIENTSERVIIFKIKTTAPEGYRVRPSLGIVQPQASGEVDIFLQPGRIKRASEDRFLVMVMQTDSDSMTQQQIAEAFKNVNKEQNKTMEHRLSCQVGSDSPKDGNSGTLKTPRGSKSGATGSEGGSGGSNGSGGAGSGSRSEALRNLMENLKNVIPSFRILKSAIVQCALVTTTIGAAGVFYSGYAHSLFAPTVPVRHKRVKACWPWS